VRNKTVTTLQDGGLVEVTTTALATVGGGVLSGSTFGVAVAARRAGSTYRATLRTRGTYQLTKPAGRAWLVGDPVYWDNTNARATTVAAPGFRYIGTAAKAVVAAATVGSVELGGPAPRTVYDPRALRPVRNRNTMHMNGLSSGSNQYSSYRSAHWSLRDARIGTLRLVFTNSYLTTTGEVDGQDDYTIKASVEYNGAVVPVYFSGVRTGTVKIGTHLVSDPVGISIPAGTQFYVRSFVGVDTAGKKWPVGTASYTTIGEGFSATTDRTDDAAYVSFGAASLFAPTVILGTATAASPSFVLIGSSSAYGQGDTTNGVAPYYDYGYLSRFLSNRYGYVKLTRASDALSFFLADHKRRLALLGTVRPTHVIQQLGSNDVTSSASFATMQTRLQTAWDILASTGAKVIQATMTPVTTSSDSWASQQTKHASNAVRVAVNDWIRSMPAPLSGVLECADAVESARNSGIWKTDGTAFKWTVDGTHVSPYGHEQAALLLRDEDLAI
jgi:predicted RecA/RadA family phage recombinase/lysophospholipase L1-like esterase